MFRGNEELSSLDRTHSETISILTTDTKRQYGSQGMNSHDREKWKDIQEQGEASQVVMMNSNRFSREGTDPAIRILESG